MQKLEIKEIHKKGKGEEWGAKNKSSFQFQLKIIYNGKTVETVTTKSMQTLKNVLNKYI